MDIKRIIYELRRLQEVIININGHRAANSSRTDPRALK